MKLEFWEMKWNENANHFLKSGMNFLKIIWEFPRIQLMLAEAALIQARLKIVKSWF